VVLPFQPARTTPRLRVAGALLALAATAVLVAAVPPAFATQTNNLLVGNTGQARGFVAGIHAANPKLAQGFTSGTYAGGYALGSIVLRFNSLADPSTAATELTATINEATGSQPGSVLCTLVGPSNYAANALNTFTAPSSGCTLTASTTYYVVLERSGEVSDTPNLITLRRAAATAEDSAGAWDWSIENKRFYWTHDMWRSTNDQVLMIEVRGEAVGNSSPTGAPTISGTPQAGEPLAADTSAILDADGLDNPGFGYQWVANATDLLGATGATYTPSDDDVGKTIRVRVFFRDNGGNAETLTSNATGTVIARPGVTVSTPTLVVAEGGSGSYTVVLDTKPSGDVTVTITAGGDVTTDPTSLMFTSSNWDTPQPVMVRAGEDDDAANDSVSVGHAVASNSASEYASVSIDEVAVTVTDDERAEVTLSKAALTVEEGGSDSYTVVLGIKPSADVTITITAGGEVTTDPTRLTFTPANWDTARRVRVNAGDDGDTANDSVSVSHVVESGSASEYRSVGIDGVAVTVTDDDMAGVTISTRALSVEEGSGQNYRVVLDAEPSGRVTVFITAGGDVTTSPTSLRFTPSNWDNARRVTVNAREDDDTTNDSVSISHGVTSGSAAEYRDVGIDGVAVTVVDDDTPGVTLSESALAVTEGGSGSYTVVLETEPSGNVTITITVEGEATTSPTSLTFTPSNWDNARRVTVNARKDDDTANDSVSISHGVTSGSAAEYRGVGIDSVAVTVTDDDEPMQAEALKVGGDDDSEGRDNSNSAASGGGGGGGPSGPSPSTIDFEWTVKHDIDKLDSDHDKPTGMWTDGTTLWLLHNGDGADDAIYAYDLETGERVEGREFELDVSNRAPRGVWSDGELVWVSDSGQDNLFAYDLATGARLDDRDISLAERNQDARGIWSDETTMWVLDDRRDALFAYDLASGELLAEYALDSANNDPHGIWSDGVTVWVSDHGAKRLFAYRLAALPEGEPSEDPPALERVISEDFEEPGRVGNNSPRGIWSDGAVMYVADENDNKVYSYNMPDAIDARLASLELSGIDFGEFSPLRYDYASERIPHGNIATLTAVPAQEGATVKIEPPDHDGDPENGHHVRLLPGLEFTITVTSPDGSRERVYRVLLGDEEEAGPSASCLSGAVDAGFSLVVFGSGSLDDLVSCAEGRHVTALYALSGGKYVSYFPGAPEFVNRPFGELFAEGVSALTPLVVRSEGPATPAPATPVVTEPFATCLLGEIGEGFSLVVYEGGSVGELEACAAGLGVTAVYALVEGEYVPYFLGVPEFVNAPFRALFAAGVPAATPLTVRGEGP